MLKKKELVCPKCKRKMPLDGFCRNKKCEAYDDIALNFEAPVPPYEKSYYSRAIGILCPVCKKQMADNKHCYNKQCSAYDPLAQYFEPPTEEEIEQDAKQIEQRLNEDLVSNVSTDDLPF